MIGRQSVVARRDLAATAIAQLVRMQTQPQAETTRALEHAFGLLARESDSFAENVGSFGEPLLRDCGQHVVAHVTHVVILSVRELRRQRVRAEERLDDVDTELLAEPLRDAQHLQFAREIEPVARLHFERRHAFAHQRLCARQRLRQELVFVSRACGAHRRHDSAARAGDVFVCRAAQPCRELVAAVARVNQVRVAFDQAGRDPQTARFGHDRRGPRHRLQLCPRADPCDASVTDCERAIGHVADAAGFVHGREVRSDPHAVPRGHSSFLQPSVDSPRSRSEMRNVPFPVLYCRACPSSPATASTPPGCPAAGGAMSWSPSTRRATSWTCRRTTSSPLRG